MGYGVESGTEENMKIKNEYIMRKIAGETVIVPVGDAAARFSGMITLNETGEFIWTFLQEENSEDGLLNAMLEEFEVDRDRASADIAFFLEILRKNNMLEE